MQEILSRFVNENDFPNFLKYQNFRRRCRHKSLIKPEKFSILRHRSKPSIAAAGNRIFDFAFHESNFTELLN